MQLPEAVFKPVHSRMTQEAISMGIVHNPDYVDVNLGGSGSIAEKYFTGFSEEIVRKVTEL